MECGSRIGEVEEYKYLGVTVKAGLDGGFKSMGDRMVDAMEYLVWSNMHQQGLEINM